MCCALLRWQFPSFHILVARHESPFGRWSKVNHREQLANSWREIEHHSRPSSAHAFMIDLINKLWAYKSDRCVYKPATFYDFIRGSTFAAACITSQLLTRTMYKPTAKNNWRARAWPTAIYLDQYYPDARHRNTSMSKGSMFQRCTRKINGSQMT